MPRYLSHRRDPATLLLHRGFVPTRSRAVISAHIKRVVYKDRPDPGGRAVRHPILSERRDVQIVSVGDLLQFVLSPRTHSSDLLVSMLLFLPLFKDILDDGQSGKGIGP